MQLTGVEHETAVATEVADGAALFAGGVATLLRCLSNLAQLQPVQLFLFHFASIAAQRGFSPRAPAFPFTVQSWGNFGGLSRDGQVMTEQTIPPD